MAVEISVDSGLSSALHACVVEPQWPGHPICRQTELPRLLRQCNGWQNSVILIVLHTKVHIKTVLKPQLMFKFTK